MLQAGASVNAFITTMNSSVAEVSTCTVQYFNEASVLCMFLTLYSILEE